MDKIKLRDEIEVDKIALTIVKDMLCDAIHKKLDTDSMYVAFNDMCVRLSDKVKLLGEDNG